MDPKWDVIGASVNIHPFVQKISIEPLLYVRHCSALGTQWWLTWAILAWIVPLTTHVRITGKLRNRSVETLPGCQWVPELGCSGWRKDCLCGFPVTDPESGSTELETETASSVEGRSLNPWVQKEQKEDFGGRLFLRVLWSSKHFISSSCRILQHPILWIYHSVFIFCFWSFDCFQFLSFTNRATINIKKKKNRVVHIWQISFGCK